MSLTFNDLQTFRTTTCCHEQCGIIFAMPAYYYQKRREDHSSFYCPNGHGQSFTAKSDAQKWKEAYENEQRTTQFWRNDARSKETRLTAAKGQITRIKNRIANGVCPCCNRTFSNIASHMKTKHPEYRLAEDKKHHDSH